MSKTRKILSLVLALVMIVSTFAVSAFAAASYESEEDIEAGKYNQTWALSGPADNGDNTYTVDVNLTTDYATGAIQFVLTNTAAASVTYTDIALGDAIPADYNAQISAYEKVNTDGTSKVTVMIIPTTEDVSTISAVALDGIVAKVTYTLVSGSATIALDNNPSSATNPAGTLIAGRASDGNLVTSDMITGQNVAITAGAESVTIGSAAKPTLVLSNGVTVNANYCNTAYTGVIFGFASFGSEANYRKSVTSSLGDEYIVYEANADGKNGTGAVIKLVDLDKTTVLESYVVVVFGDVNGDGRVTTADTTFLAKNRTTLASSTGADKLSANVNGDARHAVTTADTTYLAKNRTTMASLQTTIAATY